jgi:hypothetical protein
MKDIENLLAKSKKLNEIIHESSEICQLKQNYNNLILINQDIKNIHFNILEEQYNIITIFENNLDKLNYSIYICNILYKKRDTKYMLLYENINNILEELIITFNSILIQTKNVNFIFR